MQPSDEDPLQRPESQVFEWKRSLSLRDAGLESLCGMVNSERAYGEVVFGLAPDGSLVGIEPGNLDRAQQGLARALTDGFEPALQFEIDVLEHDDRCFILISARRSKGVPYHEFRGRAFIREGTTTRQLTLEEKRALHRSRDRDLHGGPWRCDKCGAWAGILSIVELTADGPRKSYRCRCGGEYQPAG